MTRNKVSIPRRKKVSQGEKNFSSHYFNFVAWTSPRRKRLSQDEKERWMLGELEVKGCHLRRGGRKEDLKAKAVDLEHSKAKKDNNDDLEWFVENFLIEFGQLDRSFAPKKVRSVGWNHFSEGKILL